MAQNLRIANLDGAVVTDLLRGIFRLENKTYRQRNPAMRNTIRAGTFGAQLEFKGYDLHENQIGLIGEGLPANLIAHRAIIERAFEANRLWHADPLRRVSYWLEMQAEGEAAARRSLLYEAALIDRAEQELDPFLRDSKMYLNFEYTRHPLWENVASEVLTSSNNLGWSNVFSPSASPGTAPGRIAELNVTSSGFNRMWLGIKPTLYGTTGFIPVWEAEAGFPSTDTTETADGSASGGTLDRCTFGTNTNYVLRFSIPGDQVYSSNHASAFGRFLVLARVRCVLDAVVNIGIATRFNTSVTTRNEPVQFGPTTAWRLVELGEITIPPFDFRSSTGAAGALANFIIDFYAERVSGTQGLDIDSLILIPSNHFVFVDNVLMSTGFTLTARTFENDTTLAYLWQTSGSALTNLSELTMRDFYYPVEGGIVCAALESDSGHSFSTFLTASLVHFPRWLSYRS